MNMEDKEFIKKYILNNPFDFKQGIISHCREMDKIDVYNWVAEDELKIDKLKQENKHLDEVNCKLRRKIGQLEQEKEKITKSRNFHLRFNKSLINRVDEYQKDKEIQQKEFITYLDDEIKNIRIKWGNKLTEKGYIDIAMTVRAYQIILKKYKEIIGVSDENNKQ